MKIRWDTLAFILLILLASCSDISTVPATLTITPAPKQPEPGKPLISGQISGISDIVLVTIHIRTPSGWEAITVKRQGSGPWKTVLSEASGYEYIVTLEAAGYESDPTNYTVHVSGEIVYLVENGQITSTEALELDFTLMPTTTPNP